jgi:uncharacterized iron-regulated protein
MNTITFVLLAALTGRPAPQLPPGHPPLVETGTYVPQRVFDTRRGTFGDFEMMLADLARADVVLVGEQHDDPNTHRLEAAILDGLDRRKVKVSLSLEMFERDVQPRLDAYLAGSIDEEAFLKDSRPWPRYASDYRALVEMAKDEHWRVTAANVPRRLASDLSKAGKGMLDTLPAADKPFVARELKCPADDDYYRRFAEQMGEHPAAGAAPSDEKKVAEAKDRLERFYWAQCLKDETMAESIVTAFEKQAGPGTVVHFTGAFHSDFGEGTAERVRRRLPGRRVAVVSIVPVDDVDTLAPAGEDLKRAEYLVFTISK